jgi:gliding motility-associated protein GldC
MSDEIKKKSNINIQVGLDENHVPLKMKWRADDSNEGGDVKAMMLTMWDEKEENTVRIDLWNKEMNVFDMQRFFHQSLLTMADTYSRATGQEDIAKEIRTFANDFAEKTKIMS